MEGGLPGEVGNRITRIVNYLQDVLFFLFFFFPLFFPLPLFLPHLSPTALILLICFYPILRETNPTSRGDPQKDRREREGGGGNVPPGAPTTVMSGPRRIFPQPLTCPYGGESLLMLRISKITFDRHNGRFALKWPFWHLSLKLQVYQSLRLVSLSEKCQS